MIPFEHTTHREHASPRVPVDENVFAKPKRAKHTLVLDQPLRS